MQKKLVPDYIRNLQVYQAGKPIDEVVREKGLTINGVKGLLKNKKNIDEINKNNINEEYLRSNIKKRSKNILKKIKEIKKYGKKNSLKGTNGSWK